MGFNSGFKGLRVILVKIQSVPFGVSRRFNSSGTTDPEREGTTILRNVGDSIAVHTA